MLSLLVVLEPGPGLKGLGSAVGHTVRLDLGNCWHIIVLEAWCNAFDCGLHLEGTIGQNFLLHHLNLFSRHTSLELWDALDSSCLAVLDPWVVLTR